MNSRQRQHCLRLLGLARRAGAIVTGESGVVRAIQKRTVFLVVMASDIGPATRKKVFDKGISFSVPVVVAFSRIEISQAIGQNRMLVGITEAGFARKIQDLITIEGE